MVLALSSTALVDLFETGGLKHAKFPIIVALAVPNADSQDRTRSLSLFEVQTRNSKLDSPLSRVGSPPPSLPSI